MTSNKELESRIRRIENIPSRIIIFLIGFGLFGFSIKMLKILTASGEFNVSGFNGVGVAALVLGLLIFFVLFIATFVGGLLFMACAIFDINLQTGKIGA